MMFVDESVVIVRETYELGQFVPSERHTVFALILVSAGNRAFVATFAKVDVV